MMSARRSKLSRLETTKVVRLDMAARKAVTISCSVLESTEAVGSSRIKIGGSSNGARQLPLALPARKRLHADSQAPSRNRAANPL